MRQRREPVPAAAWPRRRLMPAGQRLSREIGQHFSCATTFTPSLLVHRCEDIIIDPQSGAHASDANASVPGSGIHAGW